MLKAIDSAELFVSFSVSGIFAQQMVLLHSEITKNIDLWIRPSKVWPISINEWYKVSSAYLSRYWYDAFYPRCYKY